CGRTTSHPAASGCDSGGEPRSRDAQQGCPRAIRQKPECEAQLHIYDYLSAPAMQGLFGLDARANCSEIKQFCTTSRRTDPLARCARVSPSARGRIKLLIFVAAFSPSVRGDASAASEGVA